jgi:glutamate synthase (NADPH/NADH) large chain
VFDYYCNLDMVEISLVDDKLDRKELHELVRQHYLYTGSNLARMLLDDWSRSVDDFVKVIPIEYKHVLEQERLRALTAAGSLFAWEYEEITGEPYAAEG